MREDEEKIVRVKLLLLVSKVDYIDTFTSLTLRIGK